MDRHLSRWNGGNDDDVIKKTKIGIQTESREQDGERGTLPTVLALTFASNILPDFSVTLNFDTVLVVPPMSWYSGTFSLATL